MKKKYCSPDFDLINIKLNSDLLNVSDPEPTVPGGGGGSTEDPFGEI